MAEEINSQNLEYEDRGINTDELPPEVLQKLVDENPELKEEEEKEKNNFPEIDSETAKELKLKE